MLIFVLILIISGFATQDEIDTSVESSENFVPNYSNSVNMKNLKLVLSFEEKKKNLYLLVYSLENIKAIKRKLPLRCFTNAAESKIKDSVDIDLISESLGSDEYPNLLQVYRLEIEKCMGEYWCEISGENSTLESNKILAYKYKRGNEYAIKLEARNICQKYLCDLDELREDILDNIFDDFDVEIRTMEILHFNTEKDILDVLFHITTGANEPIIKEYKLIYNKLQSSSFFKIEFFRSSEYCFPETTVNGLELELHWPLTKIHTASVSEEFCLVDDGTPITRRCQGDFVHGAQWASLTERCSQKSVSNITQTLKQIAVSGNLNDKMWEQIKITNLSMLDFYYLTLYLETITEIKTRTTFDLINKLMVTDETILKKSQTYLNLTDTILETIDDIFTEMNKNQTNVFSVREDNFIVHVTKPFLSNTSGLLLYRNFSIRDFQRGEDFQNVNLTELELAIYVPEMILEQLYNETENLSDIAIVTEIFTNDHLFVDENFKSASLVASVSIPGYGSYLKSSIQIIFKSGNRKLARKCGFWDKGKKENRKKGEWSTLGSNYKHFNQTDLHLCSYIHLTHFALLVMSDRKTLVEENEITENFEESTEYNLEVLTLIGSCFSAVGILGIFITALSYRKWRTRTGTKILLNLSVAILLEITCIHLSEIKLFKNSQQSCKMLGISLHYLVLSKFFWMLVYALLQYYRFVKVLGTIPKNLIFKSILVGWGMPLVVVFISAAITTDENYASKSYEFCYPRDLFLYIFVLTPIALIIFANLIIYFLVMYNISSTSNSCGSKKMFKLRMYLALLLFSVMGLPWLFGILAELLAYSQINRNGCQQFDF